MTIDDAVQSEMWWYYKLDVVYVSLVPRSWEEGPGYNANLVYTGLGYVRFKRLPNLSVGG